MINDIILILINHFGSIIFLESFKQLGKCKAQITYKIRNLFYKKTPTI